MEAESQKKAFAEAEKRRSIIKSICSGADAFNIPLEVVQEWTDGFHENNFIGEGGFGKVYQGRFLDEDNSKAVFVAVKKLKIVTLQGQLLEDFKKDAIACLQREIKVLNAFKHPNIIQLRGYTRPAQMSQQLDICLVYELASEGGLQTHLKDDVKASKLTWWKRIRILKETATALSYMHRHTQTPAFHRDIKSANIALTHSLQAKLIDCGLAKYAPEETEESKQGHSSFTRTGQRFGTPGYMCSWYNTTGEYDSKAEIYSFGIVIMEILCGKLQGSQHANAEFLISDADDIELDDNSDVDQRAGEWPDQVVKELKELAQKCVAKHKKRMGDILVVVRKLREIESMFVSEQLLMQDKSECELKQMQQLVEEMKGFQVAKQSEASRKQELDRRTCNICFDDECTASQGVDCPVKGKEHFICKGCFQEQMQSQLELSSRMAFLGKQCKIVCSQCPESNRIHSAYTDHDLVTFGGNALWMQYKQAIVEQEANKIRQQMKREFDGKVDELRKEVARKGMDMMAQQVAHHRLHITDQFLNMHCPNKQCNHALFMSEDTYDFIHDCFCIDCVHCNGKFCGWCACSLPRDNMQAHAHVKDCHKSLNKGDYYGTAAQMKKINADRARDEIKKYLLTVDAKIRDAVKKAIEKDCRDIGIESL